MRFINSSFTDAGFNLAAEEYLLKQGTEDVFMLWQSAPSVIIGKHQRVETEVNRTMAEQNKIPVFRRFSGGGAVCRRSCSERRRTIGYLCRRAKSLGQCAMRTSQSCNVSLHTAV